MAFYGWFIVHCFFNNWLERSYLGVVNIEKPLESYFRVRWSSVHNLRKAGEGRNGSASIVADVGIKQKKSRSLERDFL